MTQLSTENKLGIDEFLQAYEKKEFDKAFAIINNLLISHPDEPLHWINLFLVIQDSVDQVHQKIQEMDGRFAVRPEDLRSMVILLGPYRNLTTLTGSILHLHPQCQTLNHAGSRILQNPRLNFLKQYDAQRYGDFIRYALSASVSGKQGPFGGSIRHSHAFKDHQVMQNSFSHLYGDMDIKPDIQSLVWKESHRILNLIHLEQINLDELLSQNQQIRFLMPVRNVMDCAISNLKTGHDTHFRMCHAISEANPVQDLIRGTLTELKWFIETQQKSAYGERFMLFFETEMRENLRDWLIRLARFMDLEPDPVWLETAEQSFQLKPSYPKEPELVAFYTDQVTELFAEYPEIQAKLLVFAQS